MKMANNHIRAIPPIKYNKYYTHQNYGGYSRNQIKSTRDGWTLPNCTAYASGWFNYEANYLMGNPEGLTYEWFIFQAENFWWQCTNPKGHYYNKFETSQKAREGALMVWEDDVNHNGHVAIVDKVYSDGSVDVAESSASGAMYKTEHLTNKNGRWGYNSHYRFLGFIYNPGVKDIGLPDPVKADKGCDQVEVLKTTLRVRTYPTLKDQVIGLASVGFYNVLDTKEADGYIWYKVGDWQWMAGVSGTLKVHKAIKSGDMVSINEDILNSRWLVICVDDDVATLKHPVIECSMTIPLADISK